MSDDTTTRATVTGDTRVSRRDVQARIAAEAGLDLVDLLADPPESGLFAGVDHHLLVAEQWVPWRRLGDDGALGVASVAPLGAGRLAEIAEQFGVDGVTNLITTDWDIEHVVLDEYRARIVADATDGLAEQQPELSSATPWRPGQLVGLGLLLVVVVVALVLWPNVTAMVALTVTNVVFLAAASFKVVAAAVAGPPSPDEASPPDRVADEDLPLFTLLVPAYQEAGITQ